MAYGLINVIDSWRSDEQYYQIVQKAYLVNMASEGRGYVYVKIGNNNKLYDEMFFAVKDIVNHTYTKELKEYDPSKEFLILFHLPDNESEVAWISFEAITDIR